MVRVTGTDADYPDRCQRGERTALASGLGRLVSSHDATNVAAFSDLASKRLRGPLVSTAIHPSRVGFVRPWTLLLALGLLPITTVAAHPDAKKSLADKLRNGPGMVNHPVHVAPSSAVTIPSGWPLDIDGTVTCTTCHASLPALDGSSGPRLRGLGRGTRDSEDFCTNCHVSTGVTTAAGMHWQAVSRAHISDQDNVATSTRGTLDRGSVTCLACHDGVTAGEADHETSWNRGSGSFGDRARNHPIGVDYPRGGRRGKGVQLRPTVLLPQAVRLPGGTVGCLSCHNLYATDRGRLSVPIEGSRLCMTCHPMD